MDPSLLAQSVTAALVPCMPYLLTLGEKADEAIGAEIGKKLGDGVWERASALWSVLHPRVAAVPSAQDAARDVADTPEDPDARAALRLQLRKLLAADPPLAAELAKVWEQTQPRGTSVTASGERSVAIGGSATDSTIVTGDHNQIDRRS